MAKINPYLNFNGNCEEAFNFYKAALGGEFATFMRFKDVPSDVPSSEADADKVMHVALPLGDGQVLMGSDRAEQMGPGAHGDNISLSVSADSEVQATDFFNALAAGGNITMPLQKNILGRFLRHVYR